MTVEIIINDLTRSSSIRPASSSNGAAINTISDIHDITLAGSIIIVIFDVRIFFDRKNSA